MYSVFQVAPRCWEAKCLVFGDSFGDIVAIMPYFSTLSLIHSVRQSFGVCPHIMANVSQTTPSFRHMDRWLDDWTCGRTAWTLCVTCVWQQFVAMFFIVFVIFRIILICIRLQWKQKKNKNNWIPGVLTYVRQFKLPWLSRDQFEITTRLG